MSEAPNSGTPAEGEVHLEPGTPEYDQAMAAKYRAAQGEEPTAPNADDKTNTDEPARPEWLDPKFKSPEELAKAYAELVKTLSGGEKKDEAVKEEPKTNDTDEAVQDVVKSAGLEMSALRSQIEASGTLTEEQFAALAKVGLGRELVEEYVGLVQVARQAMQSAVVAHVGGEDKLNSILDWAAKNLSAAEKVAYNEMLRDDGNWRAALDTLSTKMAASSKTAGEPSLISGQNGSVTTAVGYQRLSEMKRDMANPLYRKDPAFREEVARKMATAAPGWRER